MKLATLKIGEVVEVRGDQAYPLTSPATMLEFIQQSGTVTSYGTARPVSPADLAVPLSNPSKIIAIGLNYVDHANETKLELPKTPLVFAKFPSSLTAPTDPIFLPEALTTQVDYEVELGVVIGKRAKNVARNQALEYVFGYTVLNDISARDLQFGDTQWVRAKSLDSFCPLGPVIVTTDELPDPQGLALGCAVNGRTLQQDTTRNMIFGVAELIEQLSHAFTLEPGDIIASGTPSGVGFTRQPPIYLRPGDILRTWVEGIGELVNPVVAA